MTTAPQISGLSERSDRPFLAPLRSLSRQTPVVDSPVRLSLPNATEQTTPNRSAWRGLRSAMIVVGTSLLSEYAKAHPKSAATLRALNALLQGAAWQTPEDLSRACGALLELTDGTGFILKLHEPTCYVELQVNFAIGITRVLNIAPSRKG